jgi:hypothetical protein
MAKWRRKSSNRPNATGRNDNPQTRFVRLDFRMLESLAFRSLSPNARALLIELIMLHNGENNGSLYLALQDAAARMGVADPHTAASAFVELQERGFIAMTRNAHFKVKAAEHSRARTWRLNFLFGPGRRSADWTFLDTQPPAKSQASKRAERGARALKAYRKSRDTGKFPDVEFSHCEAELTEATPDAVRNFHTVATESRGSAANNSMGDFHTYIANHGAAGEPGEQTEARTDLDSIGGHRSGLVGWWQPDCSLQLAQLAYAAILTGQLGEAIAARRAAA